MTWYSGYSLSQTLYICHYCHGITKLPRFSLDGLSSPSDSNMLKVLKAYVAGTLLCAHLVWSEMIKGNVFDEEDFSTSRTGLPFYAEVSVLDAIRMMDMALEWIELQTVEEEPQLWAALTHRIQARVHYLRALNCLSHDACFKYPQAKDALQKTLELYIHSIHPCAQAVHVERAFNPMIICTFHSSAPPRPVAILPLAEALDAFRRTLTELLQVCVCVNYPSIHDLTGFLRRFGAQKPDPSPVSRSWLITTIQQDRQCFGQFGMNVVGREQIEALCPWVGPLFSQPRPVPSDARQALVSFEAQLSQYTLLYYKLRGKNKSRQRRCLHKLLSPLDALLNESKRTSALVQPWAEQLGLVQFTPSMPPAFCLEALVMRQQYAVLVELLSSGFLLELYSRYEWVVVYYYLAHVLEYQVGFFVQNLGWSERPSYMEYAAIQLLKESANEPLAYPRLLMIEGVLALVSLHLTMGCCFLLNVLIKHSLHPAPFPATFPSDNRRTGLDSAFSALQSDEIRFHHRFSALGQVRFLPYLTYQSMVSKHASLQALTTEELISQSTHHFSKAKDLCQELKDLANRDPSLFSAALCPNSPTQEINALLDVAHSNISFLDLVLNLGLDAIKSEMVGFSDSTLSAVPWVISPSLT
ncbi:N-alpha-acetyltransferase, non-catalitic subunit, variant 2 [Entomophthora muscae]|nr:N-alpha-acetyltransferase, non-catalitic subunit, variant 2 [Entomophthora muscae]